MSPNEKKQLNDFLASLDRNERAKLAKRAGQLRKLAPGRQRARTHAGAFDDEDSRAPLRKQKSLEEYMWQIVSAEATDSKESTCTEKLLVVGVLKNGYEVMRHGAVAICRPRSQNLEPLAVGDEALVDATVDGLFAVGFSPRTSWLSRPDVANPNRQRVIASNLDAVVIVVSVVSPPLHPRLIDRYLLAIHHGGCEPVLVVNKLDLADHATRLEELHKLKPYEGLNIPTFECIAHSGQGIAQLRSALAGKTAAFVGHSGVGKSSIVNAFDPKLQQDVGDVSATYGRGTHTTTRSSLIDLGDVRVIDTPGIRSFGLWNIGSEELKLYFPEFERVGRCRFSDCSHVHEPRCAVKDAAESGAIPKERYTTYLRLLQEL